MKYIIRCFVLACFSTLCSVVAPAQQQLTFDIFKDDIGTVGQTEIRKVFKTQSSYKNYFGHNAPSEVNFSRDWVVFYSAGLKKTNGYSASISKIDLSPGSGHTLKITTSLHSPGTDCQVNQLNSKPFVLARFKQPQPKINYVSFYRDDKMLSCQLKQTVSTNASAIESEKWVITPTGAKGATGTVSINIPEGVEWHLDITSSDNKALGKWDDKWNNKKTINLIPGDYNIFFTYLPVQGVPIQKGMNTRLKGGILNVVTTGQWSIHDESKAKVYVIYYKPSKIGLPIGKYNIQINGQYQLVEIKDGEVTEF